MDGLSTCLEGLQGAYAGSALLLVGHHVHEAGIEITKPDGERETTYRDRNRPFLAKRLSKRLGDMHPPLEKALIMDAVEAAKSIGLKAVPDIMSDVEPCMANTAFLSYSADDVAALLDGSKKPDAKDPFIHLAEAVYPQYKENRDKTKELLSERDKLLAKMTEIQKLNSNETFYPDANSTLRLSAGHVEGYEAADAVWHHPTTFLKGLVDKHEESKLLKAGEDDYECPQRLLDVCRKDQALLETPVNILYSTDTVGGNSGSPVLNADGEFVAINFDRQRQGLMNEFKWSPSYSRSIGVDVRYILWLVGEYDSAKHLVEEMTGKRGSAAL